MGSYYSYTANARLYSECVELVMSLRIEYGPHAISKEAHENLQQQKKAMCEAQSRKVLYGNRM